MMIQAVLGNPYHPEYGVATIPFPIPHDQYTHCMELLEALEIGDAVKADCQMQEINSFYSVLKRMEMLTVNNNEQAKANQRIMDAAQTLENASPPHYGVGRERRSTTGGDSQSSLQG